MPTPSSPTTAALRSILARVESVRDDVANLATTHAQLEHRVALLELADLHRSTDLIVACDCGTPVRVTTGSTVTATCATCATDS
jgi:hypothetical protein